MKITTSSDIDSYVSDADDYELDALMEDESAGKSARATNKPRGAWRNVENYLEDRKLRQALREYYDDFGGATE